MSNYDIGTLPSNGAVVTRNNYSLSTSAPTDVFEFRLGTISDINIALTDISGGDDADLRLYRDVNHNGVLDATDRASGAIASSTRGSNADDSINLADRAAGTYFAEVSRYGSSIGNVSYDIAFSTANPSNLLPVEENLGNLSRDVTRNGFINNNDTSDVRAFSLGFNEGVNIIMSGLSADVDIRVIRDANGDRNVDPGDEVVRSARGGTNSDVLLDINLSGNYFVQVYQFGNASTNYSLTFDHFTTPFA